MLICHHTLPERSDARFSMQPPTEIGPHPPQPAPAPDIDHIAGVSAPRLLLIRIRKPSRGRAGSSFRSGERRAERRT